VLEDLLVAFVGFAEASAVHASERHAFGFAVVQAAFGLPESLGQARVVSLDFAETEEFVLLCGQRAHY